MVFISLMTGHMTKSERNRARPASTWFGGMDGRDSALRVIARTTKILVKDVIISSSAGATREQRDADQGQRPRWRVCRPAR